MIELGHKVPLGYKYKTVEIGTDVHVGNKHAEKQADKLPKSYEETLQRDLWLLGDIVDLAQCTPQDLHRLEKLFIELHEVICKGRYEVGNHCKMGNRFIDDDIWIREGVLAKHSDLILDRDKWLKYRNGERAKSAGFLQRMMAGWSGTLNKKERKLLVDYAKSKGAHTLCIGHVHPEEIIEFIQDGVRVICFPQGFHKAEV